MTGVEAHIETIRRVNDLLRSLGNKRAADHADKALAAVAVRCAQLEAVYEAAIILKNEGRAEPLHNALRAATSVPPVRTSDLEPAVASKPCPGEASGEGNEPEAGGTDSLAAVSSETAVGVSADPPPPEDDLLPCSCHAADLDPYCPRHTPLPGVVPPVPPEAEPKETKWA